MSEIKEKKEKILAKIQKLNGKIEIQRAKLKALRMQCDHPNKYPTSCMGDLGTHCPDCGYST